MQQLKIAWEYRFWIVTGLVAILPILGYFINTRDLGNKASQRHAVLKQLKGSLEGLQTKENPNNRWVDAASALRDELKKDAHGAWWGLYRRQEPFPWPNAYFKTEIGDLGPTNERVAVEVLNRFPPAYQAQVDAVWRSVQPMGVSGSKQLVELRRDLMKPLDVWPSHWGTDTPKLQEIWLAQEDVWIFRAVLNVIINANAKTDTGEPINSWSQSRIKRVHAIAIGPDGVDDKVRSTKASLIPRSAADTKDAGYYVEKNNQFRVVPVALKLDVDQREITDILAEFGDSGMPIQITQVRFSRASERPDIVLPGAESGETKKADGKKADPKKPAAKKPLGKAPLKEDEFFHMTELEVWGRVFIYEKPPGEDPALQPPPTPAAQG